MHLLDLITIVCAIFSAAAIISLSISSRRPPSEARIREIVREEIARAQRDG